MTTQAAYPHISTHADYARYARSVENFLERNNVAPGCHSPYYDQDGDCRDAFFSWTPCECCGRSLGGDRETYQFATKGNEQFDADICVDCVYFLTCGQLDDMTMMQLS